MKITRKQIIIMKIRKFIKNNIFGLIFFSSFILFYLIFILPSSIDCDDEGNLGYGYDKTFFSVYAYYDRPAFSGCSLGKFKIAEADVETFQPLNWNYSIDSNNVYFRYIVPEESVNIINRADPKTFEILEVAGRTKERSVYGKDATSVFRHASMIEGADPHTYEVIEYRYGKDINNVYYLWDPLEDSDPETFEIIDSSFSKDSNNVYYRHTRIENAEPETFEIIGSSFSKDINNVYHGHTRIENAEPETFEIIDREYVKDKNHVYFYAYLEEEEKSQLVVLPEADPESFEVIYEVFSKDKNHIYNGINIEDSFDLDTFEQVKYRVFRDKNGRYDCEIGFRGFDKNDFYTCESVDISENN